MYFLKFSIIITLVFSSTSCFCQSEKTAVISKLDKFKTALEAENYSEAISYIDSATVSLYDSLLNIINNADSATLNSTPLIKKVMALSFRHYDSTSYIKHFNGKQLLAFAMKKGMVAYHNMVGDSILLFQIQNSSAKVITSNNPIGTTDTLIVQLVKEHEEWKISLTAQLSYAQDLIKRLIQESGKPENEFIFSLLESVSGFRPSQEIWNRN